MKSFYYLLSFFIFIQSSNAKIMKKKESDCLQPGGKCITEASNNCCTGGCRGDVCTCLQENNPCRKDEDCCDMKCEDNLCVYSRDVLKEKKQKPHQPIAAEGEPCNYESLNGKICGDSLACLAGKCQKYLGEGEKCSHDKECGDSITYPPMYCNWDKPGNSFYCTKKLWCQPSGSICEFGGKGLPDYLLTYPKHLQKMECCPPMKCRENICQECVSLNKPCVQDTECCSLNCKEKFCKDNCIEDNEECSGIDKCCNEGSFCTDGHCLPLKDSGKDKEQVDESKCFKDKCEISNEKAKKECCDSTMVCLPSLNCGQKLVLGNGCKYGFQCESGNCQAEMCVGNSDSKHIFGKSKSTECVKKSGECHLKGLKGESDCCSGLFCSPDDFTCIETFSEGKICIVDNQCFGGKCENGKCASETRKKSVLHSENVNATQNEGNSSDNQTMPTVFTANDNCFNKNTDCKESSECCGDFLCIGQKCEDCIQHMFECKTEDECCGNYKCIADISENKRCVDTSIFFEEDESCQLFPERCSEGLTCISGICEKCLKKMEECEDAGKKKGVCCEKNQICRKIRNYTPHKKFCESPDEKECFQDGSDCKESRNCCEGHSCCGGKCIAKTKCADCQVEGGKCYVDGTGIVCCENLKCIWDSVKSTSSCQKERKSSFSASTAKSEKKEKEEKSEGVKKCSNLGNNCDASEKYCCEGLTCYSSLCLPFQCFLNGMKCEEDIHCCEPLSCNKSTKKCTVSSLRMKRKKGNNNYASILNSLQPLLERKPGICVKKHQICKFDNFQGECCQGLLCVFDMEITQWLCKSEQADFNTLLKVYEEKVSKNSIKLANQGVSYYNKGCANIGEPCLIQNIVVSCCETSNISSDPLVCIPSFPSTEFKCLPKSSISYKLQVKKENRRGLCIQSGGKCTPYLDYCCSSGFTCSENAEGTNVCKHVGSNENLPFANCKDSKCGNGYRCLTSITEDSKSCFPEGYPGMQCLNSIYCANSNNQLSCIDNVCVEEGKCRTLTESCSSDEECCPGFSCRHWSKSHKGKKCKKQLGFRCKYSDDCDGECNEITGTCVPAKLIK